MVAFILNFSPAAINLVNLEFGLFRSLAKQKCLAKPYSSHEIKKQLYLIALAHPNGSLDGLGVALKMKVRQSNDDEAC